MLITRAETTDVPIRRAGKRERWLAVLGSAGAALTIWLVAVPLAGIDLEVQMSDAPQNVGPASVAVSALLAAAAGLGCLAVLRRITKRPARAWTIVASAVLVLSLAGPLDQAESTSAMVTLVAMHLAVAAVLIPLGRRLAGAPARS
ncbi:MAG TPA: DUF6069 family protein [Actinomycetes bacterium]|nr:DUF6069 family protein [Actinomycetes bacterium]